MKIKKVLNNNVLVKIPIEKDQTVLKSGIVLVGVEQDYYIAEVVMAGPGSYDQDGTFKPTRAKPGDIVVLEHNFHHVFPNAKIRNRIDHTVEADSDDEYNYYLTYDDDIYLRFNDKEEAMNSDLFGTLYSVMHKQVTRKSD